MVRLAIFNIPIKRRLQTLGVFWFMCMLPMTMLCWTVFGYLLFNKYTCIPMITYYSWYTFIDKSTFNGKRTPVIRYRKVWNHFRDYFPISLNKTADLDPKGKYVFGYHPHGIISIGAFCNFGTNATGFREKFPGIDLRLLTLPMNFKTPFWREYILSLGMCDSSKKACDTILQKGPGSAIMLVIGGAAESLEAHPGTYDLVLGNRKGFVRVAVKAGAALVPVIGLGETDVFEMSDNKRGSAVRTIQDKLQKILGFAMPFFYGRGIFNYDFGMMPFRNPINVVVGKPIPCPKFEGSMFEGEGKALVDKLHAEYIEALRKLWDDNKDKYESGLHRKTSFRILGKDDKKAAAKSPSKKSKKAE